VLPLYSICSLNLHIQPAAYLASKKLIKCAWRLTIDRCVTFFIIVHLVFISEQYDSHRTLVPIMYPPNTVALGCLYTASLLTTLEPPPSPLVEAQLDSQVATILKEKGDWERMYMVEAEDLEGQEFPYLRSPTDYHLPQKLRMYLSTYSYKPRKIRQPIRLHALRYHLPHTRPHEINICHPLATRNLHQFHTKQISLSVLRL
jgi:hypothetical protein